MSSFHPKDKMSVILQLVYGLSWDGKTLNMAILEINTHEQLLSKIANESNSYLLLYKKGSEISDCSYKSLQKAMKAKTDFGIMVADVNKVKDIHKNYGITTVPSLLIFKDGKFKKAEKGCNSETFYTSLIESSLFKAQSSIENKQQKRVKVYSTPTCSWCKTIKRHFDQHGIKYTDIDVSRDQKAAEEMVRRSGQQGVPQTEIGGEIIVGFDKKRINSLLGIK